MALIPCAECGKQVSTLAAACPSCGAPVADARTPVFTAGLLGKITAALATWLVFPWIARLIAFLGVIAMLMVMFLSAR